MKRYLFAAAIAAVGLGIVLVYSGVIGSRLMVPGTVLVAIGLVLFPVAAIVPGDE